MPPSPIEDLRRRGLVAKSATIVFCTLSYGEGRRIVANRKSYVADIVALSSQQNPTLASQG